MKKTTKKKIYSTTFWVLVSIASILATGVYAGSVMMIALSHPYLAFFIVLFSIFLVMADILSLNDMLYIQIRPFKVVLNLRK